MEICVCFILIPPDAAVQSWLKSEVLDMEMHYLQQAKTTKVRNQDVDYLLYSQFE